MNTREKVLVHRGMDLVRKKQFEEALKTFDRVLAMNPEIAEVWNNRGVALYGLGRWEEALHSYDRCLAIDPENMDALRNKGFLLRGQMRLEEALQVYDCVLQKGGDAYDLESTAAVLTGLGRLEEALNCLLLAREAMPLERLEEEIGMVKSLIEGMGAQSPQESGPQGELQGKE
jgi:tetratricopeptide (TPR) repeat protein